MLKPAHPIDWGSFYSTHSSSTRACISSRSRGVGKIRGENRVCARIRLCSGIRRRRRRRVAGKRDEKNAGTNLGTVRMEMPCRCYSHLHSDFRYKPLFLHPLAPAVYTYIFAMLHSSLSPPLVSWFLAISSVSIRRLKFVRRKPRSRARSYREPK